MNVIIYYFIVTILYLGVATFKTNHENGALVINEVDELATQINTNTSNLILLSILKQGTVIESYFFRLKLVSAFEPSKYFLVKVPHALAKQYEKFRGLSILSSNLLEDYNLDTLPSPPGFNFMQDMQLGFWVQQNRTLVWNFHPQFEFLYKELGWLDYRPTWGFFQFFHMKKIEKKVVYGLTKEFGPKGNLTKKFLKQEAQHLVP
jgi:hypothetical protein